MKQDNSATCLIIEDDDVFRPRLARALSLRGLNCSQAATAADAVTALTATKPDFVVLDLRIGKDSGIDLLPTIKKLAPASRVVVLTGYGSIATAVEALRLGAHDYLTKPVDADRIFAALTQTTTIEAKITVPSLTQVEWEHINRVINDHRGNISQAAKALGMHRRSLQRKISKTPATLK
jgi:two-component system response regulator RegA